VCAVAVVASACQIRRERAPVGVGLLKVEQVARATDRVALSPVAWSPDGQRFAYGGRDGVWVHRLGDAAGTKIAPGAGVTAVAWSPTMDAIAFIDQGAVWTVGTNGRGARRIAVPGVARTLAWAPGSGDRMVVVTRSPAEAQPLTRLWVTGRDGSMVRQILWDTRGRDITALSWFPDALYLFVGLGAPDGSATTEWWKVRIAYPDFRRLPGPPRPVLESAAASDGRWVAFVATERGTERVYVQRTDGGGLRPLADPARRITGLAWAPHGDKVAFAALSMEAQAEIVVAAASTGTHALVTGYRLEFPDPAAGLSLVWSPDERHLAYGTNTGSFVGPVWLARFAPR
jgi:dipeptidyl aminopeptidase/acylaminoacyl peptidase